MLFDLTEPIKAIGYIGILGIIFAESGLFFGFFLPGDSLLVTAGLLASQGFFNIFVLLILLSLASILGNVVGFWMGKRFGKPLFNSKHVARANKFYKKHGGKALILARFIPVVRTFVPIVAGTTNMNFRKFLIYNCIGGVLWVFTMLLLGYFLGNVIPDVDKYLLPFILIIIFVSLVPTILGSRFRKH